MLSLRNTLGAGLCAALIGLSLPAAAATTQVTFSGSLGSTNSFFAAGNNVYTDSQKAFFNPLGAGTTFSFTFEYDPTAVGANSGTPYTNYPVTLVSGQLGGMTDFSSFTPVINLSSCCSGWDVMDFQLNRLDLYVPQNFNRFTTQVTFTLVDQQGALFGNSLPTTIDPATLEQENAEFRISGPNQSYRYFVASSLVGVQAGGTNPGGPVIDPPTGPGGGPVSPVPEPTTWSLMILGFLGVGVAVRHSRRRQAALAA